MKIIIILCTIVILACLYQSSIEPYTGNFPQLYASREMPCNYRAYTNPA